MINLQAGGGGDDRGRRERRERLQGEITVRYGVLRSDQGCAWTL